MHLSTLQSQTKIVRDAELTSHPVAAVVAHEVHGRVDHVHGHVDAGRVVGLDAIARGLQETFDARTGVSNRLAER